MRVVVCMVALALTATGCATASNTLQSAISVHNTAKRIIETVDAAVAPAYQVAGAAADAAFPNDSAAFSKAMAPLDAVVLALNEAKQAEQLIQLGVAQWQSGVAGGEAMAEEMAACGSASVERLSQAAALIPGVGPVLYAATAALQADLARIANGAHCPAGAK